MVSVAAHEAEFSRIVDIEGLAEEESVRQIEANAAEREALARRFGLVSLDRLTATVRLHKVDRNAVRLDADFDADVVQSCVVTLQPVAAHVSDSISVIFAPEIPLAPNAELDLSPIAEELPEPLTGSEIDVGEAVAQQLALVIDPYPRAPGVRFEPANYPGLAPNRPEDGPFAALASLRKTGQN